jgi:hypothetical protein
MLKRMCRVCSWWGEGHVVEIFEARGVRRAKIVAAGTLVEVAALGGGEIHLGDRIALDRFDPQRIIPRDPSVRAFTDIDDPHDDGDDTDIFSRW